MGSSTRARLREVGVTLAVMSLASVVLVGCAGQEQSGTPAHEVSVWVAGAGAGASIGTVEVDMKNVDLAFSQHDPSGEIRSVCALLASDAGIGNGNLPTPDQELSNELSTAYATAYDAGTDCYKGAGSNSKLLATSAAERTRTNSQLTTALDRIAAVTGHAPSTTTTTAPLGSNVDPFGN
jgi:hypothetical protein